MTTITVTKDEDGKLVGFAEKDRRAWARFKKRTSEMESGEMVEIEVWFARSGPFHRLVFQMWSDVFDAQEFFADYEDFRKWLTVGAGFVLYVPAKDGGQVAIPKSLSYRSMDDEEFRDVYLRSKAFLRSEYARGILWAHLNDEQSYEMVEKLLAGYEG